jgi:ATP-dependent protease ClpP protease subunit
MIKAYLKAIVRTGGKGKMGVGLEVFRLDTVTDEDVELTDSEAEEVEDSDVSTTAIMRIYESIGLDWWTGEGITAKSFSNQLDELGNIKRLNIHINCLGGDCHTAQAIHSIIADYSCGKKTSYIDGVCASAATIIASAADEVIARHNTNYMVHYPWSVCVGNANDMSKAAEDLEKLTVPIVSVYKEQVKGKIDESKIRQLMEEETWMTANEALDYGFVDKVRGKINAIARVNKSHIMCSGQLMNFGKYHYMNVPNYPFKKVEKESERKIKMADSTETLTQEIIRDRFPEVYASIQTEARQSEQARIASLDAMNGPGLEELITAAKADGRTPDKIAMEALNITKQQLTNGGQLAALKRDSQAAGSVSAGDAPTTKPPASTDKKTKAVALLDAAIANNNNKRVRVSRVQVQNPQRN